MPVIPGTNGEDFLFGTDEADTLLGYDPADPTADTGNDQLFALSGNDRVEGGGGDDLLHGAFDDDTLLGGEGNDTLSGDIGADVLTGDAGDDVISWQVTATFLPVDSISATQDLVTDFEGSGAAGGDTLLLFDPNRHLVFGGLIAMPAIGGALPHGGDGFTDVFYAFDTGDTVVLADSNDDGIFDADDFSARLAGMHQLVASDFGATQFVLPGTPGADSIQGDVSDDTIFGLDGKDTISGGDGNDIITGGDGMDSLTGGDGIDRISGGIGADTIEGGGDRDILTGDAGNDLIEGNAGDDQLAGGDAKDTVSGGDGDDTIDGDPGNDLLNGGAGDDDFFGDTGNDTINGDAGNDELFGDQSDDHLNGGMGDDSLEGDAGADQLTGGSGDDEFIFFLGPFNPSSFLAVHDMIVDFEGAGSAGGDLIAIEASNLVFDGEITINPIQGAPLPGAHNGVTDVVFTISGGSTWLMADENDNGVLDKRDFTVQFQGSQHFTTDDFSHPFLTVGTEGNDTLTGTPDNDTIFGLGGDDSVTGAEADDELHGGTGNDSLDGGPGGFDNLFGEKGDDRLTLATSDIGGVASGGEGNDVLFGSDASFSNFDNSLQGDTGNDELHAGAVGTSMNGGGGSDRLFSGAADDQMEAGRDEFGFDLDNAQDFFVYTGPGRWSTEDSFFGDIVSGFQDGSDVFDMRGSGLQFADLTIVNEDFQTTITSVLGKITIFESFGQEVFIDQSDFLFS